MLNSTCRPESTGDTIVDRADQGNVLPMEMMASAEGKGLHHAISSMTSAGAELKGVSCGTAEFRFERCLCSITIPIHCRVCTVFASLRPIFPCRAAPSPEACRVASREPRHGG